MLDETTCPVCGIDLKRGKKGAIPSDEATAAGIWAVAHYLAHLVQQNQPAPPVPHHRLCQCPECRPVAIEDRR